MNRCGITAPGYNGPWTWLCVQNDCDGIRHRWLNIEGDEA